MTDVPLPTITRPCNIVGMLLPGQLLQFETDLPRHKSLTATVESTALKCELDREHPGHHATCVGFITVDGDEEGGGEVWATWPPDDIGAGPILWLVPECMRAEWCIFFDGHDGVCSKGHTA